MEIFRQYQDTLNCMGLQLSQWQEQRRMKNISACLTSEIFQIRYLTDCTV